MRASFQVVSLIAHVETIAWSTGIRELRRLEKVYGRGRWRKRKGIATVQLMAGRVRKAEIHWYEAHGIGRREFKIKRFIGN